VQYHEVRVNIEFREASDCFWYADTPQAHNAQGVLTPTTWANATNWNTIYSHHNNVGDFSASLWVDYIYLERIEYQRSIATTKIPKPCCSSDDHHHHITKIAVACC
jgi:hypothetical protein